MSRTDDILEGPDFTGYTLHVRLRGSNVDVALDEYDSPGKVDILMHGLQRGTLLFAPTEEHPYRWINPAIVDYWEWRKKS